MVPLIKLEGNFLEEIPLQVYQFKKGNFTFGGDLHPEVKDREMGMREFERHTCFILKRLG